MGRRSACHRLRFAGRGLLVLALLAGPPNAVAHHQGKAHDKPYVSARAKTDAGYRKQREQIARAYGQYRKKAARVWGKETVLPDARRDVTYRDRMRQRSIVDYAEGVVKVEVALKPGSAKHRAEAIRRLEDAIEKTILQGPDQRSIVEIAENPEPPESDSISVLAELIANDDGTPFRADELADFTAAKSRDLQMRSLRGKDGKARIVVSTELRMVPDHIRRRAEKFRDSVERYAGEHQIPIALIYAIIETESSFNPRARSPIPAFGLMQLVPERAARDAYKFLHTKDRVVSERYLYVPDKNIELGVAYLRILYHRYFRAIEDPEARLWATIAAYNGGAHSVIKAFAGKYRKKKWSSSYVWKRYAFKQINGMEAAQVYRHLRRHLPAGETRRYLKKVRKRMEKYSA